ncbi:hypothetical protein C8R42DRAFT_772289 [Lentinula raphanica]|nr:hypothetical protein C8R42DRAFT_772289 [Lentinula raphanica]
MLRRSQRVRDKKDVSGSSRMQGMSAASGSNIIDGSKHTTDDEDNKEYEEDDKEYEEDDNDDEDYKEERVDDNDDEDYKEERVDDNDDVPKKKKSRKATSTKRQRVPEQFRKVRGRLGLLEKLAKEMPLDVILEIFCYLEPRDLLRLARTTRDLRAILMSKTRESIWRLARGNVEDLPPRPVDLNEPQYAHLLFESYCHICMRSGRCDILWNFRMRSCQKCLRTFPKLEEDKTLGCHPLDAHYNDIIPTELDSSYRTIINPEIVRRYKTEYDALKPSPEERDAWISSKQDERLAIEEHIEECKDWYTVCLENRAAELNALRKNRQEAILDRLEEIGWRDEAELILKESYYGCDAFSLLKPVNQTRKLTDYGWRCIEDEVVEFLSEHRERRLVRERRDLLYARVTRTAEVYDAVLSNSDLREPQPTIGDVLCNQVFQSFIQDTPESEDLTDDVIRSKLLENLPEFVKEWRVAKDQKLLEIMQKSRPTATVNDLHLATTVFECDECFAKRPLYYPQIFYHHCCTSRRGAPLESLVTYLPTYVDHKGQWSHLSIKFSEVYSDHVKALVQQCSLDPNIATFQDIYDANLLFECTTCERDVQERDGGRYFMRWPLPAVHNRNHTLTTVNISNQEEEKVILASEPNIKSVWYDSICCAHCHKKSQIKNLVEHLKAEHEDIVVLPESENSPKLQSLQRHWYWNPRMLLEGAGEPFRYREDSATAAIRRSEN